MAKKNLFKVETVSKEAAQKELRALQSQRGRWRTSKFDPLKQHIHWLERGKTLRIDEMGKTDIANLRTYIDRNIDPPEKNMQIVVRSARIDETGEKYRAYVSKEKRKNAG